MEDLEKRMVIEEEWDEYEYGVPRRLRGRWSSEEVVEGREGEALWEACMN